MVEIELGDILKEKLKRLVELGYYSSISEAVRDAVRRFLERIDLKEIALNLYLRGEASFQYITSFAEMSFDDMIEYFLARGLYPMLGATSMNEIFFLDPQNKHVLDPLTIYIIYKADLFEVVKKLSNKGYVFYIPSSISGWAEALFFRRLSSYLKNEGFIKFFDVGNLRVHSDNVKLTLHEQYAIYFSKKYKAVLISDDIRTREYAAKNNVVSTSVLSLIYTLQRELSMDQIRDYIFRLKTIPISVPEEFLGGI
ncbi:ribbon-helix-helix domain-containing protein [Staphylothermus hellenicus]|uniref:Putative transcriptional regulator, CopG/Arc/MetJ family n=1 Tax=Staphylothermus hellenicus (strain DSM 12710 / JCM 10830 / BK20S6-10-b1 / P8) TaxID=591019 RepID=D7D995_STAHD|nr:type II toxin-antitoxin system ParD family antitoxin [Staphylothermus hellenicus]ADI32341.1 putative transcriptional regulator, CopG/Arc/MetJ family [Staphylothermus hellenicus DSM 12710]